MGLNARDIQLLLCRVLHISAEKSYSLIQRHPLISGALLVFFVLYIFVSFIYNFLVYISPFLVCTAIFVRIFWSSEQTHIIYVKREDKKGEKERVEPKHPKYVRREVLYKCPSQNATSRRRNFTGRKLDVYGGLEQKAKDLSAVFRNEFTKMEPKIRKFRSFQKEKGSLDYGLSEDTEASAKQTLSCEPSMLDLVTYGAGCGVLEKEKENMKDEKEAHHRKKSIDLTEDDQKNLMDLGIAEMERTKRLESLIARRRARKLVKLQIENGLIDMKLAIPSQIAPLFIARVGNPFEGTDGIEMPGSAPSTLRSPFDLPYDPSEEKPNLTGDSFDQEFTSQQKDMPFCRHESFTLGLSFSLEPGQDRLTHPRVRRHPGKGTNDWLEQLISKEGGESESKALNPLSEGEETRNEADGKCKTDMAVADMKDEEEENAHETKSMTDHTNEPDLIPNVIDVERATVSEKPVPKVPKPPEKVFSFPISSTTATSINDSLYESLPSPVDKNQDHMFFTARRFCHTPSCSLASDLHVEVSEVGSPTLTVDGSHETNTTTDGESIVYDGDIDKDNTSGSEDMWGASHHSREVQGVSEQDIAETNNWRDIAPPILLPNIDEENAADVSSMSSGCDMPEDTPTHAISSDHNIFSNVKDFMGETDAPKPSHSSYVPSRCKRLIDTRVDHLPDQTHSGKPEEQTYSPENSIQESNMSSKMNDAEVYNKEYEDKLKNDENSEKIVPLFRQDATAEPPGQAEMMTSEDMTERSRELSNDKVSLNSLVLESSSEVHYQNEDKSQASIRQGATMEPFINADAIDTSYTKDFEGRHNDLNNNEAKLSCGSAGESDKMVEIDKPNQSSEEVNFLQSESKHVIEDHVGKEKWDKSDMPEDSPLPMVTEITKGEDNVRESNRMNKNEVPEQALNKNETMVLSDSAGEGEEGRNNT